MSFDPKHGAKSWEDAVKEELTALSPEELNARQKDALELYEAAAPGSHEKREAARDIARLQGAIESRSV